MAQGKDSSDFVMDAIIGQFANEAKKRAENWCDLDAGPLPVVPDSEYNFYHVRDSLENIATSTKRLEAAKEMIKSTSSSSLKEELRSEIKMLQENIIASRAIIRKSFMDWMFYKLEIDLDKFVK